MKNFFKSIKSKILLGLFIIMLFFALQTSSSNGFNNIGSKILGFFTIPVNNITTKIRNNINSFFDYFQKIDVLKEQNNEFKNKISELESKLIEYKDLEKNNENLKEILKIKENFPNLEMINATIVSRDSSDHFFSFIINKGSNDGITNKSAIITSEGLLGIVSQVESTYSKVLSIYHPSINIGAYGVDSDNIGIVSGDITLLNERKIKMSFIPRENKLNEGESIATSGIGNIFPRGLLLGKLESMKLEEDGLSVTAILKPALNVENVTRVVVIQ